MTNLGQVVLAYVFWTGRTSNVEAVLTMCGTTEAMQSRCQLSALCPVVCFALRFEGVATRGLASALDRGMRLV